MSLLYNRERDSGHCCCAALFLLDIMLFQVNSVKGGVLQGMTDVLQRQDNEQDRGEKWRSTMVDFLVGSFIGIILLAVLVPYTSETLFDNAFRSVRMFFMPPLQLAMEKISIDYEENVQTGNKTLIDLQRSIGPEGTEQQNMYGRYFVEHNRFIKFVENYERPAVSGEEENLLKVSIMNKAGASLDTLFTQAKNPPLQGR